MILDRQKEIVYRARHRQVMAFVKMEAEVAIRTDDDLPLVEVHLKNASNVVRATPGGFVFQSANIIETDDECNALVERDPAAMQTAIDKLRDRNRIAAMQGLSSDEQDALFESEDVMLRASGVPARISHVFSVNADPLTNATITPFGKLNAYFQTLAEKLLTVDGRIVCIDVCHKSAVSARDYYRLPTKAYAHGHKLTVWDQISGKVENVIHGIGYQLSQKLH